MTTRELLAEYARLMNAHGVDSAEAKKLLAENSGNEDFIDLAALSRRLKMVVGAPEPLPLPDSALVQANQEESSDA